MGEGFKNGDLTVWTRSGKCSKKFAPGKSKNVRAPHKKTYLKTGRGEHQN